MINYSGNERSLISVTTHLAGISKELSLSFVPNNVRYQTEKELIKLRKIQKGTDGRGEETQKVAMPSHSPSPTPAPVLPRTNSSSSSIFSSKRRNAKSGTSSSNSASSSNGGSKRPLIAAEQKASLAEGIYSPSNPHLHDLSRTSTGRSSIRSVDQGDDYRASSIPRTGNLMHSISVTSARSTASQPSSQGRASHDMSNRASVYADDDGQSIYSVRPRTSRGSSSTARYSTASMMSNVSDFAFERPKNDAAIDRMFQELMVCRL